MKLTWKTMSQREKDAAVNIHIRKLTPVESSEGGGVVWMNEDGMMVVNTEYDDPAALAEVKERFESWDVLRRLGGYVVSVFSKENRSIATAQAPTEAEAFAIAALRASGVEVEA